MWSEPIFYSVVDRVPDQIFSTLISSVDSEAQSTTGNEIQCDGDESHFQCMQTAIMIDQDSNAVFNNKKAATIQPETRLWKDFGISTSPNKQYLASPSRTIESGCLDMLTYEEQPFLSREVSLERLQTSYEPLGSCDLNGLSVSAYSSLDASSNCSGKVSSPASSITEAQKTTKKVQHKMIEKRYRYNILEKMSQLAAAIHWDRNDSSSKSKTASYGQRSSKAAILSKATEYIHQLEEELKASLKSRDELLQELLILRLRISMENSEYLSVYNFDY